MNKCTKNIEAAVLDPLPLVNFEISLPNNAITILISPHVPRAQPHSISLGVKTGLFRLILTQRPQPSVFHIAEQALLNRYKVRPVGHLIFAERRGCVRGLLALHEMSTIGPMLHSTDCWGLRCTIMSLLSFEVAFEGRALPRPLGPVCRIEDNVGILVEERAGLVLERGRKVRPVPEEAVLVREREEPWLRAAEQIGVLVKGRHTLRTGLKGRHMNINNLRADAVCRVSIDPRTAGHEIALASNRVGIVPEEAVVTAKKAVIAVPRPRDAVGVRQRGVGDADGVAPFLGNLEVLRLASRVLADLLNLYLEVVALSNLAASGFEAVVVAINIVEADAGPIAIRILCDANAESYD